MEKEQVKRIKKVQNFIQEKGLDGFLISNWANIFYLTGVRGASKTEREFLVFVSKDSFFLVCSPLYSEEVLKVLPKENIILPNEGFLKAIDEKVSLKSKKLLFESYDLKFFEYQNIKKKYKSKLIPETELFRNMRKIKDKFEIEKLRKAAELNDLVFEKVKKYLKVGISEIDVKRKILEFAFEIGAEDVSFEPIVAFSENSSKPHHRSSNRILKKEDIILIDSGVSFAGYQSDMTRMFFLQKPKKEFLENYQLLLGAQQKAKEKIKAGNLIKLSHLEAEKVLREKSKYFIHSLGHGVGIEIHEEPILHKKSKEIFSENMVVTVEPGIYFEEKYGIRIEDIGIISKNGFESFSKFSREIDF